MGGLREIAAPFVVPARSGARVRTRLRVPAADAAVLRARARPPDQAAHDRSGPPDSQDNLLPSQSGTV